MTKEFNWNSLPDDQRVAFYGSMFALAAADGTIDRDEMALIYESLDTEGLSGTAQVKVRDFLISPPCFVDCLETLSYGTKEFRFAVMLTLIDIALADEVVEPGENEILEIARHKLGVNQEQVAAMEKFVREVKRIRVRGIDDNAAAEALKHATGGLVAVGIPLTVVYFSGAVIGFSAAGITSGLAALGLGLGMVPGIGVAILIGAATYTSASWLLDTGGKRKRAVLQAERERRAQLVIRNLQAAINDLNSQIESLKASALTAEENKKAIAQLTEKLRTLQQLLAKRKAAEGVGS